MTATDGDPPAAPGHVGAPSPRAASRTSVALCTFDGERYLPELLDSLEGQSRPPDEIVVCDDGSIDRTVEILEAFRHRVDFPVHIHVNDTRLGSTKNFERATALCRHEVIFLCDQDDVWHPEKVRRSAAALEAGSELGAVFHDAQLIDERSRPMGRSLWEVLGFDSRRLRRLRSGEGWEVLLESNAATGATLAFRSRFRDLVLPVPEGWIQDYWIALLVAAVSEVGALPHRLARYRVHAGQQIGVGRRTGTHRHRQLLRRIRVNERAALLEQSRQLRLLRARLEERSEVAPPRDASFVELDAKARHLERRGRMPQLSRRGPVVLQELREGRYRRYSTGVSAAVKDLFLLDRRSPPEDATVPPEDTGSAATSARRVRAAGARGHDRR